MITPRTIAELQQEFFDSLTLVNPELTYDTSEGSVIFTLARSAAALGVQQDNVSLQLQSDSSVLTATAENLDNLAPSSLTRSQGTKGSGFVMAIAKENAVNILSGTKLQHLSTGLQFTVTSSIQVQNLFEVVIAIEAIEIGQASNLTAGTPLFSSDYPDVCFHVGNQFTDLYQGDILGGSNRESDTDFRERISQFFTEPSNGSALSIQRALDNYPLVDKSFINTRSPGVVEIWVDSPVTYSESQRIEVLNYISPYVSAGVVPVVLQVKRRPVDFTIDIKPFTESISDLSSLTESLTNVLNSFVNNLTLGETLNLNNLTSSMKSLAQTVTILFPSANITAAVDEVITVGVVRYVLPSFTSR